MKKSLRVKSYGKVNLFLDVISRRRDGFHNIRTIFQKIDLYDLIQIQTDQQTHVHCQPRLDCDETENLCYKAAQLFFQAAKIKSGAKIKLKKNIPVGAGMGGGSSNGAAVLAALNEIYNKPLKSNKLHDIAKKLGSDVPFFLGGNCAIGTGRGEKLTPLPRGLKAYILLINPGIHVSTKKAYESIDLLQGNKKYQFTMIKEAILKNSIIKVNHFFFNSFTAGLLAQNNKVKTMAALIDEAGFFGHLSGSGSTYFVLNEKKDPLIKFAKKIKNRYPFVAVTKTIA